MNLLDPNFLILGVAITALMFSIVAFLARAGLRRIIGVLIASIPVMPMVMFYDKTAAQFGWWHYPAVTSPSAPFAWYIAAALWYGAALGLIGWRMIRRWSTRGFVAFIVLFGLFGMTRDYAYHLTTHLIVFGPGIIPLLADFFAYASAAIVVQGLMRWIVGPAQSDTLARTPNFCESQNQEDKPENRGAGIRPHPCFRVIFLTFVIY